MYRCVMRTGYAKCGNKWLQAGVIPNVRMRLWFMVQIRMRQTESVHTAIQNVSAHKSDRKFPGVTSLQTFFQNFTNGGCINWKAVAFYICHRGLKHAVAETTNISSRSCLRRTSPHPAVVHELDDCMRHTDPVFNDVVNPPTVPPASAFPFCFATLETLLQLKFIVALRASAAILANSSTPC